ncbi:hypothetical protein B0T11DRAFT_286808 [Plectosphaerella cucumerina]|uniref:Uncharacterized protein n=1 Tax=Plectosphaerella cucumerina TaxID=40658 RepID=A0A8K0WZF9_9PEZI|nr:hypothetical protein B0T11DRAFT_286808 [Plectosphaerella cucumerina]
MHTLSLILAAAAAVQAGEVMGGDSLVARRALAGGNGMSLSPAEVPAWGAWDEDVHAGDAGMLSAGQKSSTQTYAAEDREAMMHVEPTGHAAPPAEEAADAEASKHQHQQHQIPRGPDFSWMWSVDGALAVGMVIVTTGLVFTAAG